jgi:hypothetical protein
MAIIRIAGVTRRTSGRHPAHKTEHENQRILHDAIYQSSHEGLRAKLTSQWIGDNGSTTAKSRKGETFEDNLTKAEGPYAKRFAENQAARKRGLPKPPPPEPEVHRRHRRYRHGIECKRRPNFVHPFD